MSEPITAQADDVVVIPGERPVPDRRPLAIAPMETWIHAEVAALGLLPALLDWLLANNVTRPKENREILVDPGRITFWRSGFDPLQGELRVPANHRVDGSSVIAVPDLCYEALVVRQPPVGLFGRLAADGVLLCTSSGTALRPASMSGTALRCRVKVDAHGRHAGDHRDESTEFGPQGRPLVWTNLHPAKTVYPSEMDAASLMLHHGGVMAALALVEERLFALPFSNLGGLPTVEREHLSAAVNAAASELLGDTWVTDLRTACEALKAQREGS